MNELTLEDIKNIKLILNKSSKTEFANYINKFAEIEGIEDIVTLITSKKIKEDNNILLTIYKILWHEIEIDEVEWSESLFELSLILFLTKNLGNHHFRSLWNKLYSKSLIKSANIVHFSFLSYNESQMEFKLFLDLNKEKAEMLGSDQPLLNEIIDIFEQLTETSVPEYWSDLGAIIESIRSRPEFADEILDSCSFEELEDLSYWIPFTERKNITRMIIKESLDDCKNLESLTKEFESSELLKQLPYNLNVLGDKIELLESNPIKEDTFTNVPKQFINTWAPKFVYGSIKVPEVSPQIKIYFPGGRHIGHSGILVKTKIGSILLDFGMSVVNNSLSSWLPLIDYVDAVLLTHGHGDHSGAIPLLMENNKELPIITRPETKKLITPLWFNSASILKRNYNRAVLKNNSVLRAVTKKKNINQALDNIYEIKQKETIKLFPNFEVTSYEASHLFGSVGYEMNIAGKRILYTGDFNADGTKIFSGTNFPTDTDGFIFDGTYFGRQNNNFNQSVHKETTLKEVLNDSKRVLIPAFSLGRSQEILYQLEKIDAHKKWKIYMTGMGGRIATELNLVAGMGKPTENLGLHIVPTLKKEEQFSENTILIAGQGMLQAGTSRKFLDYTASDEETSVVFCGFQAPGSMGNQLLNENPYLKNKYRQKMHRIKMSGHTSSETLDKILDKNIGKKIVVHAPEEAVIDEKKSGVTIPKSNISFNF